LKKDKSDGKIDKKAQKNTIKLGVDSKEEEKENKVPSVQNL
jgi:hypothetical protein